MNLNELLSEFQDYFVASADKRFVRECISSIVLRNDKNSAILLKIEEHARYNRDNGEVRYSIRGEFLKPEEVKNLIGDYTINKFVNADYRKFLVAFLGQLGNRKNLSARQIIALENIIAHADKVASVENSGGIYFNPRFEMSYLEHGNRVVNFALGRGLKATEVTTDDVLEVRRMYISEDGKINLSSLGAALRKKVKEDFRFSKYKYTLEMLHNYLDAINPEQHEIYGLKMAVARKQIPI